MGEPRGVARSSTVGLTIARAPLGRGHSSRPPGHWPRRSAAPVSAWRYRRGAALGQGTRAMAPRHPTEPAQQGGGHGTLLARGTVNSLWGGVSRRNDHGHLSGQHGHRGGCHTGCGRVTPAVPRRVGQQTAVHAFLVISTAWRALPPKTRLPAPRGRVKRRPDVFSGSASSVARPGPGASARDRVTSLTAPATRRRDLGDGRPRRWAPHRPHDPARRTRAPGSAPRRPPPHRRS